MSKVVISGVRFSYANVFKPRAMNEGDVEKFSVSVIIPKKDKASIAKLEKAIEEAIEIGVKTKFEGKRPKNLSLPLRDGDEDREDDPTYAGCMFLTASSTRRPGVVDSNREAILDEDEFYSGCYGAVSINFYPFNAAGNKGVSAGLNNLMKTKDGERLGGAFSTAEEDFEDIDVDDLD